MASLRVKVHEDTPVIYGRWWDEGRSVERRIGRGWLVAEGERGAKPNGKSIGRWRERRGVPPDGFLGVQKAIQQLAVVEEAWRLEQAEAEARRAAQDCPALIVSELADRYLEWGAEDDPHTERSGWKHSHARNTRSYVKRLVREIGADRPVDEVTTRELREVLVGLVPMRNGEPTGAKPTRKFLSNYALPLKGMFALAFERGWVEEDPAAPLPSYKPKRKRAADPMRREEYLTPEEIRRVIAQLPTQQDRATVLTMAMAGLRPGEAVALRWQDVDLKGATLRIVESRTMGVTGTPKSDVGRSVPMPEEVARELAEVRRREVLKEPGDLVFMGKTGEHVDLGALRDRFNEAQEVAEVRPRRQLRQLRNTFGTVMAASGVPLRTIQAWMGHENIATTERYASHMPRTRDAALVSAAFAVEARPAEVGGP